MKHLRLLTGLCTLFTAAVLTNTRAADVQAFTVAKGQAFRQTSNAAPVSLSSELPNRFVASVDTTTSNDVSSVSLRLPNAKSVVLTNEDKSFQFEQGFTNKAQLDANFGHGNYTFTIQSANDGTNKPVLPLPVDAYPTTPQIVNWLDLQEVEADQPLTIQWHPFTNGTSSDLVMFDISNTSGETVASSPALLETNALTGTNVSVSFTVPELDLDWNTAYEARLLFLKRTGNNTNGYPGAKGLSGYYRETRLPLITLTEPTNAGRLQFSARNYSAAENSGTANLTVTRSGADGAASVQLTTSDGTAHSGQDYSAINTVLQFAPSELSQNIPVQLLNNFNLDGSRTLNLTLSNPTGQTSLGNRSTAVLTILDDEVASAGTFQFSVRSNSVSEAIKRANVFITRTGGKLGAVNVAFTTVDGTALAGVDYLATNGIVTFPAGQTRRMIPVQIINDTLDKTNRSFSVQLIATTAGASLGTNASTTLTIRNDDHAGNLAFKSTALTTNENSTNFVVTVVRTGGKASGVSVDYFTQNGSAQAGVRYYATNGTLTFGSNEMTKTFLVGVINDSLPNGNQNFFVTLTNATGGGKLNTNLLANSATLTILDDEASINISNATVSVSEAGHSAVITLTRSGAMNSTVSVDFATANGSATAGADYLATNGTLTFPPHVSVKTITIPIVNDAIIETNEAFTFAISNPLGGALLGTTTNATVTIVNDDFAGSVQFSAANFTGFQGSNAAIKITRTGGLASGASAFLVMGSGTAVNGTDYVKANQVVTFSAGETNKTIHITLPFNTLNTTSRTLGLVLSAVGGNSATIGTTNAALLTIQHRPDPNAVPIAGPIFMSANFGGAVVNITPKLANTVSGSLGGSFQLSVTWTSGTTLNLFIVSGLHFATGTYALDNNGTFGIMDYSKTGSTLKQWDVASGSASVGSFGTFIIDAIDTTNKRVSGRFTFHAIAGSGTTPATLDIMNGKFRTTYQ